MKKLLAILCVAFVVQSCDGEFQNHYGCVIVTIEQSGENALYECNPLFKTNFGELQDDSDQENIWLYDAVHKYKLNDTLVFKIKR